MLTLKIEEIEVNRLETNFDKACDTAYNIAQLTFGIDEFGHSSKLTRWERSCCWIEVEFTKYIRVGSSHTYFFVVKAMRNIEDE